MNVDNETENSSESETGEVTTTTEETTDVKSLIEGETAPTEFVPLTPEDIKFPEDFTVSEEYRDNFLTIVNDQEMSPKDRSQALTDLYVKAAKEASETASQAFVDTQKQWQEEVKADSVVGGANLQPVLGRVNKLVTEYGSDELVQVLAVTGAGNSVHVIKFLNELASKLTEGGPVSATSPTSQDSSAAERMFPSMKKG